MSVVSQVTALAARVRDEFNIVRTELGAKAPKASPTFTGTVSGITKAMVGLGLVDNTADSAKPVSTAQNTAISARVSSSSIITVLASMTVAGTGGEALYSHALGANPTLVSAMLASNNGYRIAGISTRTATQVGFIFRNGDTNALAPAGQIFSVSMMFATSL